MDKRDADEMSGCWNQQSDFSLEIFQYLCDGEAYWEPVCCSFTVMSSNKSIKKIQSFCFTIVLAKEYFSVQLMFIFLLTLSKCNPL